MAKDRRLYARIDIGFDEHDKIYPLSDAAFRALIEMTLYARRQLTDGFLAERLTLKKWGADVVTELTTNDPDKPSLVAVDGGWQIHDFAEHQTTRADIEAKREAGAKGGRAKAQARKAASESVAGASEVPEQNGSTTLAKTETETKTDTETKTTTSDEVVISTRDRFDEFYSIWPKKVDKPAAKRAWDKAIKRAPAETIICAAIDFRDNPHAPPKQFVRNPATWLNGDGWNDELPGPRYDDGKPTPTDRAMKTMAAGVAVSERRTFGNITSLNPRKEIL